MLTQNKNEQDAVERLLGAKYPKPFSLNLAAFENILSPRAQMLLSSSYAGRYVIGHHADHDFEPSTSKAGLTRENYPDIVLLEKKAADYFKMTLEAVDVDIRPLSGVHAAITTISSITKPGDVIVSIDPLEGGHFATRSLARQIGREGLYLSFDPRASQVDVKKSQESLKEADMVYLDIGILRHPVNLKEIREAAPRATIVYDASHVLGLVTNGLFQNPLKEGADIVQGNTHKSFPGPIKAVIASASQATASKISNALSTTCISHSNTGTLLALCQTALEMEEHGKEYAAQMVRNAQALETSLSEQAFDIFRSDNKSTESHILLVRNPDADAIARDLIGAGLIVNARSFCGEAFLRIGTQELTRRGLKEKDMPEIAEIFRLAADKTPAKMLENKIRKMAGSHCILGYC